MFRWGSPAYVTAHVPRGTVVGACAESAGARSHGARGLDGAAAASAVLLARAGRAPLRPRAAATRACVPLRAPPPAYRHDTRNAGLSRTTGLNPNTRQQMSLKELAGRGRPRAPPARRPRH